MLLSLSEKDLLTSSFQPGKHGLPFFPKQKKFPFDKALKNLTSHTNTNNFLDFGTKYTALSIVWLDLKAV